MKQSQLFTKTRKDAPKDEVAKNAQLLIRAGYIHKEMAGVYALMPLGLRVMNKIATIIREEMDSIGGKELQMTALQDKKPWEVSGRWNDEIVDNWFKTALKNGTDIGLGFTHEEPLTNLMKEYIRSFRDLPVYIYQLQTKFRNEARAKSGVMRTREFLMKDLYSFTKDVASHEAFYEKAKQAYVNIFERVGLGDRTYITFASGGSFSKYSHEFQTVTDAGEDNIYVDEKKKIAVNEEVNNPEVLKELGIKKEDLVQKKAVEVGNIFSLGTRYSDAFDLKYIDSEGKALPVIMGSYGIGLQRLMGTIAEVMSDENGLVWPKNISPFQIHLIALLDKEGKEGKVGVAGEKLYKTLTEKGIEVLYDDRDVRPGEKFADSDLIGIPLRVVISEKTMAEGIVETKDRKTGEVRKIAEKELFVL
ncbi:MAG: His/Gly/Thr/Pro-type tRNA ligase C-terminal domain-containing protein [Candidatus Taylorbacteria bacterium]|nr:His/Gly/Thr/Pro-type tRNA ligase C-terminal domain-containing protein [Candidatus Taylorbacteria bacterium]